MVKSLLLLTVICRLPGFASAAFPQDQPQEDQERQYAARGVEMMMDGDLDGAIEVFRQIQRKDYQSPLGYLLESDATWWKIYYSTANLIDPDVFAATDLPTTPY